MKKQILAILPALGIMVITWGVPRLLNYVQQLSTPSIAGPMVSYGAPDAQLPPPPPDGMMPAPTGEPIPGNMPMQYPGDVKMSHPTTGSFPDLQINWVFIWVAVAIELGLFGWLMWAVTNRRSNLPSHALIWIFGQVFLSAALNLADMLAVMTYGILRPVGFCLVAVSVIGTLLAITELIARRRQLCGDDVTEVMIHFDSHTDMIMMLILFGFVAVGNASQNWVFATQMLLITYLLVWYRLGTDALRTSLRRRVDPAAFEMLEQSVARLRIPMGYHYPGRHVVMMPHKLGDHTIMSLSHLDGSISVSVAALQNLTDEELLVLTSMQAERPFYYRVFDLSLFVKLLMISLMVMVADGFSMFWLLLVLIPVLMSEYYRRYLAVAADRRAIDRLNMEKTAVSLLQKQIEDSTGEVRKALLIRAGAIFKHSEVPLTE